MGEVAVTSSLEGVSEVMEGSLDGPPDHFIANMLLRCSGDSVRKGAEESLFFFRACRVENCGA